MDKTNDLDRILNNLSVDDHEVARLRSMDSSNVITLRRNDVTTYAEMLRLTPQEFKTKTGGMPENQMPGIINEIRRLQFQDDDGEEPSTYNGREETETAMTGIETVHDAGDKIADLLRRRGPRLEIADDYETCT